MGANVWSNVVTGDRRADGAATDGMATDGIAGVFGSFGIDGIGSGAVKADNLSRPDDFRAAGDGE